MAEGKFYLGIRPWNENRFGAVNVGLGPDPVFLGNSVDFDNSSSVVDQTRIYRSRIMSVDIRINGVKVAILSRIVNVVIDARSFAAQRTQFIRPDENGAILLPGSR